MNKKLRIVLIFLAAMLMLSLFTGCKGAGRVENGSGSNSANNSPNSGKVNATGFPIVKEPTTIRMFTGRPPTQAAYDDMFIFKEYEKKTGIHIEWIQVPTNAQKEKRGIMLASNELPDAFFKCEIPVSELLANGREGTFIKLNDLINKYGPNLTKAFQEYPEAKKALTTPDGNIYSTPYIVDVDSALVSTKVFYNKKWLDKLSIKMPTTTDEFYSVLKAFKDKDPNGNGKADEVPFFTQGYKATRRILQGAWGLGNRGDMHEYVDMDEKTGKLRFIATDPRNKEVLQYMNKLYTEGLLDQDMVYDTQTKIATKGEKGILGAFSGANNTLIGVTYVDDYIAAPCQLKGPYGDQLNAGMQSTVKDVGSFVITNVNKYPEATLRWIDYFYGEEGGTFYFMGVEGVTYKVNSKGEYEYVDEIANNPNMSFDQAKGQYLCWGGNASPALQKEKYFKATAVSTEAARNLKPYSPKEIWAPFQLTQEENDEFSAIANDIETFIKESEVKFIMGKESFTKWEDYISTLKKMGVDKYMQIYQKAYDRYKKN